MIDLSMSEQPLDILLLKSELSLLVCLRMYGSLNLVNLAAKHVLNDRTARHVDHVATVIKAF